MNLVMLGIFSFNTIGLEGGSIAKFKPWFGRVLVIFNNWGCL
jgi:hypothetical protein